MIVILLFAFSDTPKMQFSKTKLSMLDPMNSMQSNHSYKIGVHCQCSHTLAVKYATDSEKCIIVDVSLSNIDVSK